MEEGSKRSSANGQISEQENIRQMKDAILKKRLELEKLKDEILKREK